MVPHILIADPDEAFGLMLKQVLELSGDYSAEHVSCGALALVAARARQPDLVIIDMAVADAPLPLLVNTIRQSAPMARFMLIPLSDTVPAELQSLGAHGTLTKPFFIGDLGQQIASALGAEVKPLVKLPPPVEKSQRESKPRPRVQSQPAHAPRPVSSVIPPATSPAPVNGDSTLEDVLRVLTAEVRAEAVLVVRDSSVLAQRSDYTGTRLERLVERLLGWRKACDELAALLGERSRFVRAQLEGERFLLLSYDVDPSTFLLAMCRSDVPLGTLRLNMRSAAGRIAKILQQQGGFATSPNPQ